MTVQVLLYDAASDDDNPIAHTSVTYAHYLYVDIPEQAAGYAAGYTAGYTAGAASAPAPDTTSPTITIVQPPAGSTIGPDTPIKFWYADEIELRRPLPCMKIRQPDGSSKYELIHDGDGFTPDYNGTKVMIQASPQIWEFTVQRKNGWTSPVTYSGVQSGDNLVLVPFGTDTGGNEPS